MPIQNREPAGPNYDLIAFDAKGVERTDDPDGRMSEVILDHLRSTPVTDVFFLSHGWMGDLPAAIGQYDRWTGAMAACQDDMARMERARPGFRPLLVGIHWPSLPWGDDKFAAPVASFAPGASAASTAREGLVDRIAARTVDTPTARAAIRTILDAAQFDIAPATLPPEVRQAYEILDRELGLGAEGPDAAPGEDREPFDPERSYRQAQGASVSFGASIGDGLLAPLRTLSFWTMKDRARRIGEGPGYDLLRSLRAAGAASGRDVRFHIMGHSFGCIVASGMVAGPQGAEGNRIASLALVQGALSLWSYCSDIPYAPGRPGYFRRVVGGLVEGPIITTRSSHDSAVGRWYPYAAGVARQVEYAAPAKLPKYGGIGAYGIQGPGLAIEDHALLDANGDYGFQPGSITNLRADEYIRKGGGFEGAHGDIDNPQVAHAVWQAAGAV